MANEIKRNDAGMPIRPLGNTGVDVSILGFGGGHVARKHLTEQDSVRLIQAGVDAGITFFDNAWEYWDGESERRMGLALEGRRDKVVLMTKVCSRQRERAEEQLHESLRRLKTDVIDVWQFHEINYDNDPEIVFADGGVMEAALAAREAGKIRFIGFTGHKSPHIFRKMLAIDFPWDTCQMPVNVLDAHYRSFQNEILPELSRRDIGVIGMKSLGGDGQIAKDAGISAEECRRFAMSQPISTLVAGIESEQNLQQDLEIARNYAPLSADETRELLERSRPHALDGRYEWFKSTQYYDSKYHRAQHSFPPIAHVSGGD